MDMNAKSPFVLASFLIGLLPVSHSIANEQTKDEVIRFFFPFKLNSTKWKTGKAKPLLPRNLRPLQSPNRLPKPNFSLVSTNTRVRNRHDLPPEAKVEKDPVPVFLSRKQEVARELQSIQGELDQLNRQSGRLPAGLTFPSSNPVKVTLPGPPVRRESQLSSFSSEKDRVARELQSIQAALDEMNRDGDKLSDSLPPEPVAPPIQQPTPVAPREAPVSTTGGGLGVYLVPSIALVHSSGFDWTSVAGKTYEIDEENGFGAGLRIGRTWEPFFADFQLSYTRSDLESNAFGSIPMSF